MATIALAEALLRRKELQGKVDQLRKLLDDPRNFFEPKFKRTKISEDLDDVILQVPKLAAAQVTREFDHYAKALRLCDAMIQQANWTTKIDVPDVVMQDAIDLPQLLAMPDTK